MQDPDLSVDTVFRDWALRRYSEQAVPYIVSAMKRTGYIQHHGRWFLGFWLTKSIGDEWGEYPYYFGHILLRSRYKWTRDPADKALEQGLYSPDKDLFARLTAEGWEGACFSPPHLSSSGTRQRPDGDVTCPQCLTAGECGHTSPYTNLQTRC